MNDTKMSVKSLSTAASLVLVLVSSSCSGAVEYRGYLIFKIARSGSSWLSTMVRGLRDFSYTEEAISARSGKQFKPRAKEKYLQMLLTQPRVPRLAQFDHRALSPSTRVMAVGGSVCPLNCRDVDFASVLSFTDSRLVVLVRSNVVKMAVASFRGAQEAICSSQRRRLGIASNLQPNCELPPTLNVSTDALLAKTLTKLRENTHLVEKAQTSAPTYLTLYYERLQQNKTLELERLKRFVGLEWLGPKQEGLMRRDRIIKASDDDLSLLIGRDAQRTLADAFADRVKDRRVANCLTDMLYAADARVFDDSLCNAASFASFVANSSSLYTLIESTESGRRPKRGKWRNSTYHQTG